MNLPLNYLIKLINTALDRRRLNNTGPACRLLLSGGIGIILSSRPAIAVTSLTFTELQSELFCIYIYIIMMRF